MNKRSKTKLPDITKIDSRPKFKLGTRLVLPSGQRFKYFKIDGGVIAKIKGKTYRNIFYRWIPDWIRIDMVVKDEQ